MTMPAQYYFCIMFLIATLPAVAMCDETVQDRYCGPRCLQRVLAHYGASEELVDLIRETQWPNFDSPTSLAVLAESITRRNICAAICVVTPYPELCDNGPVIVHLMQNDAADAGHFVVLQKNDNTGKTHVWDGFRALSDEEFEKLKSQATGHVLLTANDCDKLDVVRRAISIRHKIGICIFGISVLAVGVGLWKIVVLFRRARA